MNMLKEFGNYLVGKSSNYTEKMHDKRVMQIIKDWGIMTLIIITTTLLFPYNQWATDLLLASKLTEIFGFVFLETLALLKELYGDEPNIDVERYVAASVYARVLILVLVTVHFYRRWNNNVSLCQQIAINYHKHPKIYINIKKTLIIIFCCLLVFIFSFYSSFFQGSLGIGKESGNSLNFIDRWKITFLSVVYLYFSLKCLLFLYIVFIKKAIKLFNFNY